MLAAPHRFRRTTLASARELLFGAGCRFAKRMAFFSAKVTGFLVPRGLPKRRGPLRASPGAAEVRCLSAAAGDAEVRVLSAAADDAEVRGLSAAAGFEEDALAGHRLDVAPVVSLRSTVLTRRRSSIMANSMLMARRQGERSQN